MPSPTRHTTKPVPQIRMLVVEDDLPTLELMYEVLGSLGAEVFPASDSERAVSIINNTPFDGIFLDLNMPKVDGFALARKIRESSWNRTTPIIVITAQNDRDIMQRAFAAGGTFFLEKPVDRQRLNALLNATRGTMLKNRDRFRRRPLITEVFGNSAAGPMKGKTFNISQHGMLLDSNVPLRMGQRLRLSFDLPGQKRTIHLFAEVRRIDAKGRAGIVFMQVDAADQERIRSFVCEEDEIAV